jgi:hypothetical protein
MPTTAKLALPYPLETAPADVPVDMAALANRIDTVAGAASGIATLDSGGKVPSAQLPAVSGGATVASTVAGLGTGTDGKLGLLVLPNDVIPLTYSATLSRWLSSPIYVGKAGPTNTGGTWVRISPEFEYRCDEMITAGLKIQARAFVEGRDSSNSQNYTAATRVARYSAATGSWVLATDSNQVVVINPVTLPSISYGAYGGLEVPWGDVPNPTAGMQLAKVRAEGGNQNSGQGNADYWAALWVRYSS